MNFDTKKDPEAIARLRKRIERITDEIEILVAERDFVQKRLDVQTKRSRSLNRPI